MGYIQFIDENVIFEIIIVGSQFVAQTQKNWVISLMSPIQ